MTSRSLALPALLVAFAACGEDTVDFWQKPHQLLPMAAFTNRVAFIESSTATAFILDPADAALRPSSVKVGQAPIAAVKRNGTNQLLVLSKGDRGSVDQPPVASELDVIDVDPQVAVTRHPLEGRFDALAQSPDGRFVVLFHNGQSDSPLYNPNDLLIVDFTPPGPTLTGKSIRSLGSVPSDVVFSPPYPFKGGGRNLAVVPSQNYVTILDLDFPDRTEISVPLCPEIADCKLRPTQILFDPANLAIYVRAENTKDIFQISFTDLRADGNTPPAPPSNDFRASLSMLTVGSVPADMVLYGSGADARLAVAAPDARKLVIIDPSTSHTVAVTTAIPVTQLVAFVAATPQAPLLPKPQALLLDTQRGSTSVLFVDLQVVETIGGLALRDYALGTAAKAAYPLLDETRKLVVLMSGSLSGSNALTVVDLVEQSFEQIGAGGWLASATIESRSPSRLWGVDSGSLLCYLNLVPRAGEPVGTGEVWLDRGIVSITPLAEPSRDGRRYLAVGHEDPHGLGNVTFLDADKPDRATARTAHGFLLTDYLEREQP